MNFRFDYLEKDPINEHDVRHHENYGARVHVAVLSQQWELTLRPRVSGSDAEQRNEGAPEQSHGVGSLVGEVGDADNRVCNHGHQPAARCKERTKLFENFWSELEV